ncbi:hypothetical protein GCM10023144_07180 [Pigmentiphaga soli]|uniref:NlpC/P60 domain-containing protein n=1 Tax=Pigmentiphaga soli TaxID=1007095 RepID=A0ABP8GIM6_9BURK
MPPSRPIAPPLPFRSAFSSFAAILLLLFCCSTGIARADETPDTDAGADVTTVAAPHLSLRERVVQMGLSWIGIPYVWGGEDPDRGFDCSGLVRFVFRETLGIELPRVARQQRNSGRPVAQSQLKPGDLVFFNIRGVGSHVGIYIGDDEFLHAPSRGSTVRVDKLHSSYWARRFSGARRVILGGRS